MDQQNASGDAPPPPPQSGERWYMRWYGELKFWFQEGWKTTPAFRYFQVLVSVCAGLAIVFFFFRLPPLTALVGTIVAIGLAICMVLFGDLAKEGGPNNWLAWTVYGFIAFAFLATIALLWSWFFFEWPARVGRFFQQASVTLDGIDASGELDGAGNLKVQLTGIPQLPISLKVALRDGRNKTHLQVPEVITTYDPTRHFVIRAEKLQEGINTPVECQVGVYMNGKLVSEVSKTVRVDRRHQ